MGKTTVGYLATRHWTELWSPIPLTNNIQIWASFSAFGLAVFALFYNYLWRWMAMYAIDLPNVYGVPTENAPSLFGTSVWGYVMLGIIALAGFLMFLFCFGSLVFLIVRGFRHQRVEVDTANIPDNIKAGMSTEERRRVECSDRESITLSANLLNTLATEIAKAKKAKAMIDDFLAKVEAKDDDERTPNDSP